MSSRKAFIRDLQQGDLSFSALCRAHGISRPTGYKWKARYDAEGVSGMADRSSIAHRRPHALQQKTADALLAIRDMHPTWGPRKLLIVAAREQPELILPSHRTVSALLAKHGLQKPKKGRARPASYTTPYSDYHGPNASWAMDFKGHFALLGKLIRCYPFTVTDVTSRLILCCKAMSSEKHMPVYRAFQRLFERYGLPDAIRSDNGNPFATLAPGGLSELSIWFIKLGITPVRIEPGRPTQNSRHERMHRTLKEDCNIAHCFRAQQREFDQFVHIFNTKRPHDALAGKVPSDVYCASPKRYPKKLQEPEYLRCDFVERIGTRGALRFNGVSPIITPLLTGELVGLTKTDFRCFDVFFGPIKLGVLNHKGFKIDKKKRKKRKPQL